MLTLPPSDPSPSRRKAEEAFFVILGVPLTPSRPLQSESSECFVTVNSYLSLVTTETSGGPPRWERRTWVSPSFATDLFDLDSFPMYLWGDSKYHSGKELGHLLLKPPHWADEETPVGLAWCLLSRWDPLSFADSRTWAHPHVPSPAHKPEQDPQESFREHGQPCAASPRGALATEVVSTLEDRRGGGATVLRGTCPLPWASALALCARAEPLWASASYSDKWEDVICVLSHRTGVGLK